MKKIALVVTAVLLGMLVLSSALADTVTMNGTVVSTRTETITAALGGTVGQVHIAAGDHVSAGDKLVTLYAEKVYALEDGTVRLFGEVGDAADSLSSRYGAVAYIEPDRPFTISASTKKAYDAEANKIIHPGESVYLKSVEDSKHTGTGIVTTVSGTSFGIEVISGGLENGESAYVYRSAEYTAVSRIGKGTVSRQDPVAYSGSGIIASYRVENGSAVKKGDVLFETLSGSYAHQTGNLYEITAAGNGVIASVSLNKGGSLAAGGTVAEFYADSDLRIQATVTEEDLQSFQVGDSVVATFTYLDNGEYTVDGVIEKISRTGESADGSEEASYAVLIRPESADRLHYGMNAVIEKK